MDKPTTLDYWHVSRKAPSKFRFGVISCSMSVLAGAAAIFSLSERGGPNIMNLAVNVAGLLSVIGIVTGVAGLFQRDGRTMAIVGIVLCLAELVLVPALHVA